MKVSQRTRRKIWQNVEGWLYILPVVLGIAIFTALPIIYAFYCSFFDTPIKPFTFTGLGEFVGLDNYLKNFTVPTYRFLFWQSMKVTFVYALIQVPLTLVLSFSLALLLNQQLKGMRVFRTLFYLPVLIPAVCSGMLWSRITDPNYGVVNGLLEGMGLPEMQWFQSESTAMPSLIFVSLFGLGGNMILWLAQLKNVPKAVYESALLDGAGKAAKLFRITLPSIMSTIMIFLLLRIAGILNYNFEKIHLLYSIPTYEVGDILSTYVYRIGIEQGRLSYTTAISLFISVVGFVLLIIANAIVKRFSENNLF